MGERHSTSVRPGLWRYIRKAPLCRTILFLRRWRQCPKVGGLYRLARHWDGRRTPHTSGWLTCLVELGDLAQVTAVRWYSGNYTVTLRHFRTCGECDWESVALSASWEKVDG